jgi:uncharacterized membrane protein YhaH (DUF805 family)
MKIKLSQLFGWKGEINSRDYLIWGIILFAIKYNLDRLIAFAYNKTWYITDYFIQADAASVQELTDPDKLFYGVLLLQSLPFIWFGTVLCIKRLRNAKLPLWLVLFFFIPFLNFMLFMLLAAIPEREKEISSETQFLDRLIPKSKEGSALFSIAIVLIISLAITGLMINYLKEYGWSLFVGIPFMLGFGSVLIYGHRRQLKFKEVIGVAFITILLFSLIIFILAFEGIICIVMALPILFPIALIGATIAYSINDSRRAMTTNLFIIPLLAIPGSGFIEHENNHTPPTISVVTEIIINAPKQQIWDELVAFSQIDPPTELLFKTGISYPIHAQIEGTGVGAVRKCNFTTGSFIEPITIWNEPDLLEFGVLQQPPPLVEWSIYEDLKIEHLDGYFRSVKGQFKLEALPNGQTRLIGTTWYYHDIWPSLYWKGWSDFILHKIHLRVLTHIKAKAESKAPKKV